MEFKEKFRFVESRLDILMAFDEITSWDYAVISKKLMMAEDRIDLENVMNMIETAVMKKPKKKDEEREARRKAR